MRPDPLGGLEQIGVSLRQPRFVVGVEIVVPHRTGVASGVVPGGIAAGGRAIPLPVVGHDAEGMFDGLTSGRELAGDLKGASLKVLAAAPVLPIDVGSVKGPEVALRVILGQDKHVGKGGIEKIVKHLLRVVDACATRPDPVPLRDGFLKQGVAAERG